MAEQFNLTPSVLTQALTHKSFKHGKVPSNERLQFVGHRSLEFFAMEANMEKIKSVGELKKAVSDLFDPAYLGTKFDTLGLEAGVQCHLVKQNKN
jgi:dsRNA-specific ribonuclease